MQKGKWHRVNGKLVRRYKPRRKVVHNAELVDEPKTEEQVLEDFGVVPIRLSAILNNIWHNLSYADKVMALSSLYFDPSNPSNE